MAHLYFGHYGGPAGAHSLIADCMHRRGGGGQMVLPRRIIHSETQSLELLYVQCLDHLT